MGSAENFLSIRGPTLGQFQYTYTKEVKSQDVLQIPEWGLGEHAVSLGQGRPLSQVTIEQEVEKSGSKHLVLISWLEQRSLIFHRFTSTWLF